MKKYIAIILMLVMIFAVAGCAATDAGMTDPSVVEPTLILREVSGEENYQVQDFTYYPDALGIVGKIYIPSGDADKMPAVILSHGYSSTMISVRSYAQDLAENGYVAVTFDFRGGAANSASDGETTQMSIFTEENDLKAIVEMVCGLEYVDTDRICLLGASQGGMVSAMAAADLQEKIDAVVLLYPALCCADDARKTYASVEDIPETVEFMGMTIGKAYYEEMLSYDPYEDVTRYGGNVLIVHGTSDAVVPYDYSVQAQQAYANAELVTIEGAGHGFAGDVLETVLEQIRIFLDNNIA